MGSFLKCLFSEYFKKWTVGGTWPILFPGEIDKLCAFFIN